MSVKAVIFDLDGTITRPYFDFDAIREEMGLARDAGPVLELMQKMPRPERRRAEQILHHHERLAVERSVLNTGARQTLETLRRAGIRIGVLTRNRRCNALAVARKHGLVFDVVVARDDGPVKPDAFGVLRICQQFGVSARQTLVVGDYLFDILAARSAGAVAVLLLNDEKAAGFADQADFTIHRIDELLDIVASKNNPSTFSQSPGARDEIPRC